MHPQSCCHSQTLSLCQTLSHMLQGSFSTEISGPELGLPEPVIFGETLTRLTQLGSSSLQLVDFSGLEQLPLSVTFLSL